MEKINKTSFEKVDSGLENFNDKTKVNASSVGQEYNYLKYLFNKKSFLKKMVMMS